MIRCICRMGMGIFILSLFLGNYAWSADPYGSGGGGYDQGQSPYQGTTGPYQKSPEYGTPYQQGIGAPSPYLSPSMTAPAPGETGASREPSLPSAEKLPPLPEEPQSPFEQLVSGKVEITRQQVEGIIKDPKIRFMNFIGATLPGTIIVPVKIIPEPEKKGFRPIQQIAPQTIGPQMFGSQTILPPDVNAGYLVGPPDRIGEAFLLLGIGSPYSISMDLKHFGYDLFLQGRSGFLTTNRLPVGPDYMLGPGDEVKVRVWGKVEGAWNLTIERDGTVRMPKVGVVMLAGLTFEQAKDVLQKEFSRYYSGFEMNVTLGALRTMSVYVVGNARQPGAYTVSSLATLVNVLIQAGGPTKAGSMRDIQIRRGGEPVAHFDMYDFLRRGDKTGDQHLLPEDVIFIPPVGPVAAIAGNVNSPGLYELKGEKVVSELIDLAGGLNTVAFKGRLQVERIVDNNRQVVFESDLEESKEKVVDLRSGDILKVFQVVKDQRTVRIVGAVQREGEYGFRPGMTVKDLVAFSGGTKYFAYLKEAELTRMHVTEAGPKVEKTSLDLEKALAGDPRSNMPLQENDQLFVRTVPEWRMYSKVTVLGEFRFPGTYTVRKGEKLSSLIERAGGLTEKAYPRGAVFTRESVREIQQQRLRESVDRLERELIARGSSSLSAAASPEELKAKEGEIQQSKELVAKLKTVQATGRMVLEIDSPDKLRKTIYDIELENGDTLFVPENPQNLQTLGAVFNQTAFVFDPTKGLQDYIEMAGGYTETADRDRVFVLKVNGSAVRPRESGLFLFSKSMYVTRDGKPLLEPGDSIVVPEKLERTAWLREFKDITQIIFQVAVSAGVVVALF